MDKVSRAMTPSVTINGITALTSRIITLLWFLMFVSFFIVTLGLQSFLLL